MPSAACPVVSTNDDRTSDTRFAKAVNDKQDGLPVAASILDLNVQLLHRLNNRLARMGDVYLSHSLSYKGSYADLRLARALVMSSAVSCGLSTPTISFA